MKIISYFFFCVFFSALLYVPLASYAQCTKVVYQFDKKRSRSYRRKESKKIRQVIIAQRLLRNIHLIHLRLLREKNILSLVEKRLLTYSITKNVRKMGPLITFRTVPYISNLGNLHEILDEIRAKDQSGQLKNFSDDALLRDIHRRQNFAMKILLDELRSH